MKEQLLLLPNGLKAHLYHWGDLDSATRLNICAPGMPNYPEKEFFEGLPKQLNNEAFIVLYYYGYWFSSGRLCVDSTANSIIDLLDALRSGSCNDAFTNEPLRPFQQKISLIGYSFGANPLARAIKLIPIEQIDRILFVAPLALINRNNLGGVNLESLRNFYDFNLKFTEFLIRGYDEVLRMRSQKEWREYFSGNHEGSLVKISEELVKKIQVHYGMKDKLISRQLLNPLIDMVGVDNTFIYKEIGHSKELITKALLSNSSQ